MLQVRAELAESKIKKFRRNTCNGDQRQLGGNMHSKRLRNFSRKAAKIKKSQSRFE